MANYAVCTIKSWNIENFRRLKRQDRANAWFLISRKEDLTRENLARIGPRYVFFPHWSWIIPREIHENFACIGFHMADLPFGRGGSPLQNLIARDIYNTKVSAFRVTAELDAGDIYMKRPLKLDGSAEEIYRRTSDIAYGMIRELVRRNIRPKKQRGKVVVFSRRTPEEGDLSRLGDVRKIYDYIRMLDAEGYPPAFIETERFRAEFRNARLGKDCVTADCVIKLKANKEGR